MRTLILCIAMLTLACKKQENIPVKQEQQKIRLVVYCKNPIECTWGLISQDDQGCKLTNKLTKNNVSEIKLDTVLSLHSGEGVGVDMKLKDMPEVQFKGYVEIYKNHILIKHIETFNGKMTYGYLIH